MRVCKNTIESFPKTDKHLQCIILQNKINYFSFFRQSQASQILIEKMHTTKKEFSFLRHFIKTIRILNIVSVIYSMLLVYTCRSNCSGYHTEWFSMDSICNWCA